MAEEEIRPLEKPNIAVLDLNETPSSDRQAVTVSGTLINRGTRATRDIVVHVEALNKSGVVVMSTDSDPNPIAIAPGATGTFSVSFQNRTDVDRYHVEAISR